MQLLIWFIKPSDSLPRRQEKDPYAIKYTSIVSVLLTSGHVLTAIFLFLIWKYLVFITTTWAFCVGLAFYESSCILKSRPVKLGGGFFNSFLEPELIHPTRESYPLITLFSKLFKNFTFGIAYTRVKFRGSLLHLVRIRALIMTIFLSFFGLNRLFFKLVAYVLYSQEYGSLQEFLIRNFYNPDDTRRLYFKDGEWHANPNWEDIYKVLKNTLNFISTVDGPSIQGSCEKTLKAMQDLKMQTYTQAYAFTSPTPSGHHTPIVHQGYTELLENNQLKSLVGIQTAYSGALKTDGYGQPVAVTRFLGVKKLSTIVVHESSNLEYLGGQLRVPALPLVQGIWSDLRSIKPLVLNTHQTLSSLETPPLIGQLSQNIGSSPLTPQVIPTATPPTSINYHPYPSVLKTSIQGKFYYAPHLLKPLYISQAQRVEVIYKEFLSGLENVPLTEGQKLQLFNAIIFTECHYELLQ